MDGLKIQKKRLIEKMIGEGSLRTPEVINAFKKVPRENFVAPGYKKYAYADEPLSIGSGQTISQPTTVAIMTEALEPKKSQRILEVGTGSGYQAAVLSVIVGKGGKIYTTEIVKNLLESSKKNLRNYKNVKIVNTDGSQGLKKYAPYDRIIVTAAAPSIPKPLQSQLKSGGIMVIPVGGYFSFQKMLVVKKTKEETNIKDIGSFAFVPLIGKYGFKSKI